MARAARGPQDGRDGSCRAGSVAAGRASVAQSGCGDDPRGDRRYARESVRELLAVLVGSSCERIESVLGGSLDEAAAKDATRIRQEITRLSQAQWLDEVGEMRAFPASSQVLQRKHGYRELLGHYLSLVMASQYPIASDDLKRIIETKSASALYEYWVFFEVVRSVERLLGRRPTRGVRVDAADEKRPHLDHGVAVQFGPDVEVIYNRRFAGDSPNGRFGSYSLPLRPDVLLRIAGDVYVFDAKFRVERGTGWAPSSEDERTEEEMLQGDSQDGVSRWFKAGDIHKMHAYRDAVRHSGGVRVASAWAIYPGNEFRFYSDMKGRVVVKEEMPAEGGGSGRDPLGAAGRAKVLDYVITAMLEPMIGDEAGHCGGIIEEGSALPCPKGTWVSLAGAWELPAGRSSLGSPRRSASRANSLRSWR